MKVEPLRHLWTLQRLPRAVSGVASGAGATLRVSFHVPYIHLPGAVTGRESGGTGLARRQTCTAPEQAHGAHTAAAPPQPWVSLSDL